MKKFFYACAAILCLVLAYHFGATNAQGQGPGMVRWIGDGSDPWFATSSGVYVARDNGWITPTAGAI